MMNATIEQIQKNISGSTQNVYPITLTTAVYDMSGNTINSVLNDVAKELTLISVKELIGNPISGQTETLFSNLGDLGNIIDAINDDSVDEILSYFTDKYANELYEIINGSINTINN